MAEFIIKMVDSKRRMAHLVVFDILHLVAEKKHQFLQFYEGASSIFEFFIFVLIRDLFTREVSKMQFYDGASSIFEFCILEKIVVFSMRRFWKQDEAAPLN